MEKLAKWLGGSRIIRMRRRNPLLGGTALWNDMIELTLRERRLWGRLIGLDVDSRIIWLIPPLNQDQSVILSLFSSRSEFKSRINTICGRLAPIIELLVDSYRRAVSKNVNEKQKVQENCRRRREDRY